MLDVTIVLKRVEQVELSEAANQPVGFAIFRWKETDRIMLLVRPGAHRRLTALVSSPECASDKVLESAFGGEANHVGAC